MAPADDTLIKAREEVEAAAPYLNTTLAACIHPEHRGQVRLQNHLQRLVSLEFQGHCAPCNGTAVLQVACFLASATRESRLRFHKASFPSVLRLDIVRACNDCGCSGSLIIGYRSRALRAIESARGS